MPGDDIYPIPAREKSPRRPRDPLRHSFRFSDSQNPEKYDIVLEDPPDLNLRSGTRRRFWPPSALCWVIEWRYEWQAVSRSSWRLLTCRNWIDTIPRHVRNRLRTPGSGPKVSGAAHWRPNKNSPKTFRISQGGAFLSRRFSYVRVVFFSGKKHEIKFSEDSCFNRRLWIRAFPIGGTGKASQRWRTASRQKW